MIVKLPKGFRSARRLRRLLLALLELPAEEARRRQEQLPEADHDRAAERIKQAGLIIERHIAERVVDLRPGVEDVIYFDAQRASAQPGMLQCELGLLAEIGEQAKVERADGREV